MKARDKLAEILASEGIVIGSRVRTIRALDIRGHKLYKGQVGLVEKWVEGPTRDWWQVKFDIVWLIGQEDIALCTS